MSCKSLLAVSLVGALALFLTRSALASPWPSPALICPPARPPVPLCKPVCAPAPVCPPAGSAVPAPPSIAPGELPEVEPVPNRHTLTIFNGCHVVRQNFVEQHGSWRSTGEFKNFDLFFRDSPQVPWRYYGTYYSTRTAEDAAAILSANGNLVSVRPRCD